MPKDKSNEIKITRIYDAPVAAIWDAWTDPKQAAEWWGPRGFTLTTHSKDLKPGGNWDYMMHSPDGTDYPNKTKYLEVVNHSKLVYDHGGNDTQKPLFRVTVLFSENQGQTKMDMTMALPTPEAVEQTKLFIQQAGGNATWDRLAEYVEKQISGKEIFVINRSFDISQENMFEMWMNSKHISQWLPPAGFTMEIIHGEMKQGSSTFYSMSGHGVVMYGRVEFLEIHKPDKIISTQQFCDKDEKISRNPMAPIWPDTVLRVLKIAAEGPDQSRVTLLWEPHGKFTKEELEVFVNTRGHMTTGWTTSFDNLDKYLANNEKTLAKAAS